MKTVLITGARGFIGRSLAKYFSANNYRVIGIGRGLWDDEKQDQYGICKWISSDVSVNAIREFCDDETLDLVIHCAGGGSVAKSANNLDADYSDTVGGTYSILEYLRIYNPGTHFIYPSSPAALGCCPDEPIKISTFASPSSAYGRHKLLAETLCELYRKHYRLNVSIIRLFSVYGAGLRKQLLWDACVKFNQEGVAEFWGDGNETRDFIHIDDVAKLFYMVAMQENRKMPHLMNCGSGVRYTIKDVLNFLRSHFEFKGDIKFNGKSRIGDPRHYWSDNAESKAFGWNPQKLLTDGLAEYALWHKGCE